MAASTAGTLAPPSPKVAPRAASHGTDGAALSRVPLVRPRRALGVVVVLGVMLLQIALDVVGGRETSRILARVVYMACELPLLMLALTAAFHWSIRRSMTAAQGLMTGVAIATTFGAVFGLAYGAIAMHVPALRLHLPNVVDSARIALRAGRSGEALAILDGSSQGFPILSIARTSLFGVLNAQMYFGLWSLAFAYPFAVESARIRALEAAQLRSEAEVARLRAHLEPHFLLNTLNAIAGLVTEEPREARRLLVCLGELLRDAVQETSDEQSLEKQIAWLRRYAQILEARHRGTLTFEWDVSSGCERVVLPRLLLQPLVENAVKHGALRRGDRDGRVVVSASRRSDGTLVCVVEDNGPGMPDADIRDGAFGLHAVRRRLELLAPRASLRHESSSHGTRSIVEIGPPEPRRPEGP
jgi:signal transduction histidine kinase